MLKNGLDPLKEPTSVIERGPYGRSLKRKNQKGMREKFEESHLQEGKEEESKLPRVFRRHMPAREPRENKTEARTQKGENVVANTRRGREFHTKKEEGDDLEVGKRLREEGKSITGEKKRNPQEGNKGGRAP